MDRTPLPAPASTERVTKLLSPITSGPPLPSIGVLAIVGLTMLSLALAIALVLTAAEAPVEYATSAPTAPVSEPLAEPSPSALPPMPAASPASADSTTLRLDSLMAAFPAEPQPVPARVLTDIEAAGNGPLEPELTLLLAAIQTGFDRQSAQIEPTLRPYLFRIAGRLSVRTDIIRIAVTAPDIDLAHARAATLRRTLDVAGVSPTRVQIGAGTGAHALTLVSDS